MFSWNWKKIPKKSSKQGSVLSSWVWGGRVSLHYLLPLLSVCHRDDQSPSLSYFPTNIWIVLEFFSFSIKSDFYLYILSLSQKLSNELQASAFMSIFVVKLNICRSELGKWCQISANVNSMHFQMFTSEKMGKNMQWDNVLN